MNILHLVDEPYDSGITQYALDAAEGLRARGHRVHFGGRKDAYPLREAARRGLETLALGRLPGCIPCLRRYILKRGVEIVNAHTGSSHALAVAAARLCSTPPAVVRTRGDSRPVRRKPGSTLLWRRTDGFIAASEKILAEFQAAYSKLGIPAAAIQQGIEDPFPGGAPGEPPVPLRVGIIGRLDPVKGHIHFLRAAAQAARRFPGASFAIAGREENVPAKRLAGAAEELGIGRAVEIMGFVPDAFDFMSRCHVGVIASTGSEAVSRAAVEWMAAGRPLVATAVGGLPEMVEDGATGFLVPPADEAAMAGRMAELLNDEDMRRRMGARARERFSARFTRARLADETERFYERASRSLHLVPSR